MQKTGIMKRTSKLCHYTGKKRKYLRQIKLSLNESGIFKTNKKTNKAIDKIQ